MDSLIGSWRLVSLTERRTDGTTGYPRGEDPLGLIMYSADGWMSVQLMRRNALGELGSLATALEQYLGYYGRYTVDWQQHIVTHHVEGCSFTPWIGGDQVRQFALDGDRLTLTARVQSEGRTLTHVLVWARVQ